MKKLDFIDMIDTKGRTSYFSTYGNIQHLNNRHTLNVGGSIPHNADIMPRTVRDAKKLIDWLNEWIKLQP